jgi:ribosome-binding factor A
MSGHRPERVAERIREEMTLLLQRDIQDPILVGITVTRVEISGDIRHAKVYVSARDDADESREMLAELQHAAGYFRRRLAQNLDLRFAPDVKFFLDYSIARGERFLQLLDQVQAEERAAEQTRKTKPKGKR